ncbi:hypothetical protein [Gottfriedia solisilvae]|uniref:hypothetical protein n=1 Tax=Gottfriedia solisilvae TaxID=1516104 RepID=UPI003D2EAFBB
MPKMNLPYGATGGYYMPGEEPDPPSISKSKFYSRCESIASKKNVKCEVISDLFSNFYSVKFFFLPKLVYGLMNSAHPFVAFCLPDEDGEIGGIPMDFIDFEELAREFSGYRVMKVSELNEQFYLEDHEELRDIGPIKKQVEYWNPITIGDAMFNYWD